MVVGEDRLSELCNPIVHHIFSFLPIKCVVATSILSKRWKDLWIASPVLNIQEWRRQPLFINNSIHEWKRQRRETTGMLKIMDKVLLQSHPLFRNDLPAMKSFCLDFDSPGDDSKISGWISTIVMRKIEELSLRIPIEVEMPACLFTCETITMLKIEMVGDIIAPMKKMIRFAETISLPRLKILHLKHMIFVDESLDTHLFLTSPVLEELVLTNCYMMEQKVLHISVASLKRLSITNSKIYSCKPKIYSCKLKISSPNLQSLTYNGMPEDVHTDQTFSSIVDADIDITFQDVRYTEKGKERQCGLKNLLGGISDVKILHVSGSTLLTLYYEDMFTQMPTFHDLRRLVVSSELRLSMSMGLLSLLSILPNVESVVIAQGFSPSENYFSSVGLPECSLLQLKVVEIWEIDGKDHGMSMINYILKISPALQTMTITFPLSLSQCRRDRVKEKILMLSKGSPCCLINFLE